MGGIAGLFYPAMPRPVDPVRVRTMTDALAHRGPDGQGVFTAPGVGLGHRRLSIIDAAGSHQPMASADGAITVTFDGEIYNYAALRIDLVAMGARFRTEGDTEVLIEGWRAWGPAMLDRLDGMFALALHDARRQVLFLARDRLGVKPLHYVELSDSAFAFASELKGLLAHPLLRLAPDIAAVEDYLAFGHVPDDACIVSGVRKLAAGHCLLVERGRPVPSPQRWWDVDFSRRATGSTAALAEELIDLLRAAVRSCMVADVPLGAFMSGGLNSSAVVALMAEASREAVRTCAIHIDPAGHDERKRVALVARRFATDHCERVVTAVELDLADTLAHAFDEPFADPSALTAYRLCELARGRGGVALSSDGADEVFAGHPRQRYHVAGERTRSFMPAGLRRGAGWLGRHCPDAGRAPRPSRAKTTLLALAQDGDDAYARAVGVTSPEMRARLFSDDARRALGAWRAEDHWIATMRDAPARDALDRAQYADLKLWLPGNILAKSDRTSMAVGLEARGPMLDHRLVQFAASLPPSLRLRGGKGKWLMRKALEAHLPREMLYRPEQCFAAPLAAWFRGPLAGEATALARSRTLGETGWFDMAEIARLADAHRSGRADHGRTLWQFVMLERSLERLFG